MNTLSVVIGRFQVPSLSPGHLDVLSRAQMKGDLLILVGTAPNRGSKRGPLEFRLRSAMLKEVFKTATILPLANHPSNRAWAKEVDRVIEVVGGGLGGAVLYGGRDSCLKVYEENGGKYPTVEFPSHMNSLSGTSLRAAVLPQHNVSFRAGVIHAHNRAFPHTYPVVDVAVYNKGSILLARKRDDEAGKWRLIGGFVDPSDKSLEMACRREVMEESGVTIGEEVYVGSSLIDDWRHREEVDKIISSVFIAAFLFGNPRAADDIEEVRWIYAGDVDRYINPVHRDIWLLAKGALQKEQHII